MSNLLGDILKGVLKAAKGTVEDALPDIRDEFVKKLGVSKVTDMTVYELQQAIVASAMLTRVIIESGRFRIEALSPSEVHDIERTIITMLMQLTKTRHSHVSQEDLDDFFDKFYKDESFRKGEL